MLTSWETSWLDSRQLSWAPPTSYLINNYLSTIKHIIRSPITWHCTKRNYKMNLFDTPQNNRSRNQRISFLLPCRKTSYIQSSLWSDKLLQGNQFHYPTQSSYFEYAVTATECCSFLTPTYHPIHHHLHWGMAGYSVDSSQPGNSRRPTRSHQRRGRGW